MKDAVPLGANEYVEEQLRSHAEVLEGRLQADVFTFVGPMAFGADDRIRDTIEGRKNRRTKVALILETEGGYIEVTERIADVLRYHYGEVIFIISTVPLLFE